MKRRGITFLIMILVSAILIFAAKNMQKSELAKHDASIENPTQTTQQLEDRADSSKDSDELIEEEKSSETNPSSVNTAEAPKSNNEASKPAEVSKPAETSKTVKPQPKPTAVETPNMIITDTISSKVILSKKVEYNGETVAEATTKALNASKISYKTSTFGGAVYFSSIGGIRERSAGASSGWCYYVNGKKLSVGAGSYKLNKGDKLEWKFLKDGVSN
jgi:hypothetical protein